MKSLNKMIASAAAMVALNTGAIAGTTQVHQFGPTDHEDCEIESIQLVNGADNQKTNTHVMIRAKKARIPGCDTPFWYTGTNTEHFAKVAFGQGGATNVNQCIVVGNNAYMTFNHTNGVYKTQITGQTGPGVVKHDIPETVEVIDAETGKLVQKAKKDENGNTIFKERAFIEVDPEQDPVAKAVLKASKNGSVMAAFGGDVYTLNSNGTALIKNGNDADTYFFGGTGLNGATPEKLVLLDNNDPTLPVMPYILARDNNGVKRIYTPDNVRLENGMEADSISATDNGQKLVIQSGANISVFDPKTNSTKVLNSSSANSLPAGIKSVVVSGKVIYGHTDKKLFCKTIDD